MKGPDVTIRVKLKARKHAIPDDSEPMSVGQLVEFVCKQGALRIEYVDGEKVYKDPPEGTIVDFQKGAGIRILSNRPPRIELLRAGGFKTRCFVTPKGQSQEVGWDAESSPESGGDHIVKP
jgi:hypothetical protein